MPAKSNGQDNGERYQPRRALCAGTRNEANMLQVRYSMQLTKLEERT